MERAAGRAAGRAGAVATIKAAVGVVTRLPVGAVVDEPGAAAFAIVGAAIGLAGAVPLVLLGAAGEPVLGAIAAVASLAAISGGLHLDGLADTADAMLAPDPAAAERARHDPAIGPGGATAIVLVLGAQVAALASVATTSGPIAAGAIIVVGGALSRWLPVLAAVLLRARIGPDGLAAWFSARVSAGDAVVGAAVVALTVALAAVLGGSAVVVAALIGAAVGIVGAVLVATTRGRLDGDGLGATVEIAMTATLLGIAVIVR